MDEEQTQLPDITTTRIADLLNSTDPALKAGLERLVSAVDRDGEVISAFGNYVKG